MLKQTIQITYHGAQCHTCCKHAPLDEKKTQKHMNSNQQGHTMIKYKGRIAVKHTFG